MQEKNSLMNPLVIIILILFIGSGVYLLMNRGEEEEQEITQDEVIIQEVEEELVEEIEEEAAVDPNFPEDIPVLGGDVQKSRIEEYMAITVLLTEDSVQEVFEDYEAAMQDTDWIIEETNTTDEYHDIIFNNGIEFGEEGHRSGRIVALEDPETGLTKVTVRENY